MSTFIFQVPKEVYNKFIEFLSYTSLVYSQITDFTPIGQWCLFKCIGSTEEVDGASNYLDLLISEVK